MIKKKYFIFSLLATTFSAHFLYAASDPKSKRIKVSEEKTSSRETLSPNEKMLTLIEKSFQKNEFPLLKKTINNMLNKAIKDKNIDRVRKILALLQQLDPNWNHSLISKEQFDRYILKSTALFFQLQQRIYLDIAKCLMANTFLEERNLRSRFFRMKSISTFSGRRQLLEVSYYDSEETRLIPFGELID